MMSIVVWWWWGFFFCGCCCLYALSAEGFLCVVPSQSITRGDVSPTGTLPLYRASLSTTTSSSTTSGTRAKVSGLLLTGNSEDGELEEEVSTSLDEHTHLPPWLDVKLIQAARQPCSWDEEGAASTSTSHNKNDNDDISGWQQGQRWLVTREALVKFWILPEDVLGYYDDAPTKVENKILTQVPQLLRFESDRVVQSAHTVLHDLRLPPALLRQEPRLLAMESERLRGGFENIRSILRTSSTTTASTPLEACRETPGLLVEAALNWTK